MYAQLTYFDGPRSAELVAAAARARTERIEPAMMADARLREALVANFVLRTGDDGELVITIVKSEEDLRRGQEVIMSTKLLPGEDPALLPGPDRVEVFEVLHSRQSH